MARLYVKIKDQDNVVVAVQDLKAGTDYLILPENRNRSKRKRGLLRNRVVLFFI